MRSSILIILSTLFIFASCEKKQEQADDEDDTDIFASPGTSDRMYIAGDFNGDERSDTVFESYISAITGKELSRTLDSLEEKNRELLIQNKPICRFYSNLMGVDTFLVTKEPMQRGISTLYDLGDINNTPGDELGYIVDWMDESNLNTFHIITLSKNRWEKVLDFPINEMVSFDRENLFDNQGLVRKEGKGFVYKFYSDSATVEEGVYTVR